MTRDGPPHAAPGPARGWGARDATLASFVALLWGFNFVPIRYALDEVPPFALASLRFTLAALPWVLLVRRPRVPLWLGAAYGVAIGVGQFGLLFLGIRLGLAAGLASLVAQAQVVFTIALGSLLLRDPLRARHVLGTLLAAGGLASLAAFEFGRGARASAAGFLVVLAAAACWGVANILAKWAGRRHGTDMFALVVWSSLAAPLPLAALSWGFEGGAAPLRAVAGMSAKAWGSVLFMTYGATLFGFAAWNRLLHRHATALVAPFALLVPVAGLASAALVLGERLAPLQVAAGILVLVGLAVAVVTRGRAATGINPPPLPAAEPPGTPPMTTRPPRTPDADDMTVTLPSDTEILIRRTFRAPRRLLWKAWTDAALARRWLGPARYPTVSCEMDARVGGRWRLVKLVDGKRFTVGGTYEEVREPERIVGRTSMEGVEAESRDTVTLEERDGRTVVTVHVRHTTRANRDGHLSGDAMEKGVREGYQRLDAILADLQ